MPYDGKLLAQARAELEQRRADNAAEQQRRLSLAYARDPEIEQIDLRLRRQMAELVRLTVSRAPDLVEKLEALKRDNLELQAYPGEDGTLMTVAGITTWVGAACYYHLIPVLDIQN